MNSEIIQNIESSKEDIANSWIKKDIVVSVLNKYDICTDFFLKHFGNKTINHSINILKEEDEVENAPMMYIMSRLCKKKNIVYNDLVLLCDSLKNVIETLYDKDVATKLSTILDKKLEISKQYMDEYEYHNPTIIDAKLSDDETRLRDIRFSTVHDLNSHELIELLDDYNIDKIEILQSKLDELTVVIDKVESSDEQNILSAIPNIVSTYSIFINILSSITLFPILVRSFENLINFLQSIDEKKLSDNSKKELLIIMLAGLNADLHNWIDVVFIKQEADDIYYFDASFANNCLEIEVLFNQTNDQESKNNEIAELMDDDMMFFC